MRDAFMTRRFSISFRSFSESCASALSRLETDYYFHSLDLKQAMNDNHLLVEAATVGSYLCHISIELWQTTIGRRTFLYSVLKC